MYLSVFNNNYFIIFYSFYINSAIILPIFFFVWFLSFWIVQWFNSFNSFLDSNLNFINILLTSYWQILIYNFTIINIINICQVVRQVSSQVTIFKSSLKSSESCPESCTDQAERQPLMSFCQSSDSGRWFKSSPI